MDFNFNEDQNAIRDLASSIFTDRATDEFLLQFDRTDATYDDELWTTLAEQGLLSICVPEAAGGTGLGFTELCLILEEQGRRVAPVPLLSSLVLAGLPIAEFGTAEQQEKILGPMAAGEIKLTGAFADIGMATAARSEVSAANGTVSGTKVCVPDAAVAKYILVPAVESDGKDSVYIVDTEQDGVSIDAQNTFTGTNQAVVTFDNASAELLGNAGEGSCIIEWIEQRADTAICALIAGATDEGLKRTAQYTCERKQFGAPIGSFQAVAMRAADAYMDVEAIRTTFWQAQWRLSENLRADAEVRCAKWWACQGGHRVVHACQHLHGGMGADIEYPIHRFFVFVKHLSFMLGNGKTQIEELGKLLAADDKVGTAGLDV